MASLGTSESRGVVDSYYDNDSHEVTTPMNLHDFSKSGVSSLRSSQDFIKALKVMSVDGPLTLTNNLDERREIGRGGQFVVYQNSVSGQGSTLRWDLLGVAVKKCHFTLQPDQRLDLASTALRRQVHEMYLEVLSLQNEHLKNHRNIINLLGWAQEDVYNAMPLLVMDLAVADLARYLQDARQIPWEVKYHFCLDMSSGLDALHDSGIVHGDFKPQNVLLCKNDSRSRIPLVAKLADFGFSTLEAQAVHDDLIPIAGISEGWCAPEIKVAFDARSPVRSNDYCLADNYSLGLVVWSLTCFNCRPPPPMFSEEEPLNALEMVEQMPDVPLDLRQTLHHALRKLLCPHVPQRPLKVEELFYNASEMCSIWCGFPFTCSFPRLAFTLIKYRRDEARPTEPKADPQAPLAAKDHWELPDITNCAMEGLEKSYRDYGQSMSGGELFALFLVRSYATISRPPMSIKSPHISALIRSAKTGFLPAQAVVNRVFNTYGIPWPAEYGPSTRVAWLQRAASSGCTIARADLADLDPLLAVQSLTVFREQGGYQLMYHDEVTRAKWKEEKERILSDTTSSGLLKMSRLSVQQSAEDDGPCRHVSIDQLDSEAHNTLRPDRLLFLACLAGSWEVVKQLCHLGVDASTTFYEGGVTCLHWLFNFPAVCMDEVAGSLIRCGAKVDVQTTARLVNYNYPYDWPRGSPLHWAVVSGNVDAVGVLLKHGADCTVRNTQDPYRHNEDVRYLDRSGEMTEGNFSEPPGLCDGLNALDMATANHDWRVLDVIRTAACRNTDISDTDEEGYTPFHRLQHHRIGYTYYQDRFCQSAFLGPSETYFADIRATIMSLQALGGDINKFTSFSKKNPRRKDRPGTLTPLMLAVRRLDREGVRALLEYGADAKLRNNLGYNALSQLFEAGDPEVNPKHTEEIVAALLAHGAEATATGNEFMEFSPLASAIAAHPWAAVDLVLGAGASPLETHRSLNSIAWLLISRNKFATESWEEQDAMKAKILKRHVFSKDDHLVAAVLNNVDQSGASLLHYAAAGSLPLCVAEIIGHGADPNVNRISKAPTEAEKSLLAVLDDTYYGTPLDIVLVRRYTAIKRMERRSEMTSPEGKAVQVLWRKH